MNCQTLSKNIGLKIYSKSCWIFIPVQKKFKMSILDLVLLDTFCYTEH